MNINPTIITWFLSKVVGVWTWLDAISIGGLFSLLDLSIVIVLAGAVLPAVLNVTYNATSFGIGRGEKL